MTFKKLQAIVKAHTNAKKGDKVYIELPKGFNIFTDEVEHFYALIENDRLAKLEIYNLKVGDVNYYTPFDISNSENDFIYRSLKDDHHLKINYLMAYTSLDNFKPLSWGTY